MGETSIGKWVMLGVIGCGLVAFGYMAYVGHRTENYRANRGLVSVASVRGNEGQGAPVSSNSDSNVSADYTKAITDTVDTAQRNANKYQAANKALNNETKKETDAEAAQ